MKQIEQEVISLQNMDVVKASYKNSVYYIAGSHDITEYVTKVQKETNKFDNRTVQQGLELYLNAHPEANVLKVPKYELILLNDDKTSFDYVIHLTTDFFHISIDHAYKVAEEINAVGHATVGVYDNFELAHTFGAMIESANNQIGENLQFDIVETNDKNTRMDALIVLEGLLRRDHPNDL